MTPEMSAEKFTIRPARPEDDSEIATLVVEGFVDKFRPIFGKSMDRSVKIMERWVQLEHSIGGVRSLVAESGMEVVASVGVRTSEPDDEGLARGIWRTMSRQLSLPRTLWAAALLSYPRYSSRPSEAYIERLVVAEAYRNQGLARRLLDAGESLGREKGKETVGLHVSGGNYPARKLYESESYGEISRQRSLLTGYFLDIRDWIYLRKDL